MSILAVGLLLFETAIVDIVVSNRQFLEIVLIFWFVVRLPPDLTARSDFAVDFAVVELPA